MISLQDCIDLCGLTEEQVLAIAEHEHIPEIVAASLLGNDAPLLGRKVDDTLLLRRAAYGTTGHVRSRRVRRCKHGT